MRHVRASSIIGRPQFFGSATSRRMGMVGGPGWVSDIFDTKLVFEESCFSEVDDVFMTRFNGISDKKIKCFDGRGAISGKLIIVPPEGREITHRGVEITFTTRSCALPDRA